MLENYFLTGEVALTQDQRQEFGNETPDEIGLVIEGLIHYPGRSSPLEIEKELTVEDGTVPVYGLADLIHLNNKAPAVFDHKTTSNWKYTRSPEELLTDPQAIIYTRHAMHVTGADHALFKHVYYLTKKEQKTHRTRVSGTVITQKHNDAEFAKIDKQLQRMKELSKTNDPGEAKANPDACWDYGGCPFRHYCNKRDKGGVMGLFKDLKKEKANDKPKAGTKAPAESEAAPKAHGAVNPPESATVVGEPAPKRKKAAKKKATVLSLLTQTTIAVMPTAVVLVEGSDEKVVSRAVLLAKEILRQTVE